MVHRPLRDVAAYVVPQSAYTACVEHAAWDDMVACHGPDAVEVLTWGDVALVPQWCEPGGHDIVYENDDVDGLEVMPGE